MHKQVCNHTIHDHQCHFGWNRANPPVVRIAPGEAVIEEGAKAQLLRETLGADQHAGAFAHAVHGAVAGLKGQAVPLRVETRAVVVQGASDGGGAAGWLGHP